MCAKCAALEAVILAQQTKITLLQAEINRLRQIIANGQNAAGGIILATTQLLNKGGLPRGTWAITRGRQEAAKEIDRYLR